MLDVDKHEVTIMDTDTYSFRRLPPSISGTALFGNGMDTDAWYALAFEDAEIFVAVTQGDNRNVVCACQ